MPDVPPDSAPTGPVPDDNQPGHHADHEQDKPDLDAFARKLGVVDTDAVETGDGADAVEPGSGPAKGLGGRGRLVAMVVAALAALVALVVVRKRRTAGR